MVLAASSPGTSAGPFEGPSPLPYQAPAFDRIEAGDFRPALEEGMRRQRAEIDAIAANHEPPSFENTLEARERSGQMLARVRGVFEALTSADTNAELQRIEIELAPRLAAHADTIHLDPRLFARVKAVLRRTASQQEVRQEIRHGDLVIDLSGHEVNYRGQRVSLTATEFRILEFLAARPGRVFSRDEIIDAALGNETAVFDRTVDVHITAIRRKLGAGADQIETVRGFGYKFRHAADAVAS